MTSRAPKSRVLVIKTSRFSDRAVHYAGRRWPGADVRVLSTAGTRMTLGRLITSPWGWRALAWRPDAVVLQWWHPRGRGHEAANIAALAIAPAGFHAFLEDGSVLWISGRDWVVASMRHVARRLAGLAIVFTIAGANVALTPIASWRRWSEQRRMGTDD